MTWFDILRRTNVLLPDKIFATMTWSRRFDIHRTTGVPPLDRIIVIAIINGVFRPRQQSILLLKTKPILTKAAIAIPDSGANSPLPHLMLIVK